MRFIIVRILEDLDIRNCCRKEADNRVYCMNIYRAALGIYQIDQCQVFTAVLPGHFLYLRVRFFLSGLLQVLWAQYLVPRRDHTALLHSAESCQVVNILGLFHR